jgi:hypothetical protein
MGITTWVGQKAELPAGWRPKDRCDARLERPARCEEPAEPAAGQGPLRWRCEPAKTTQLLTDTLLKHVGTRQESPEAQDRGDASHGSVATNLSK